MTTAPTRTLNTNNGGCPICQGAVTIESNEATRNLAYYTIAHFPSLCGRDRIASTRVCRTICLMRRSRKQTGRRFSWSRIQLPRRRPLTLLIAANHSLRHCKGAQWERLYGEHAVEFSKRRKESLECPSKQDFTTSAFLVRSRAAKPMRLKGFRLG
jgi:hypothetical protein